MRDIASYARQNWDAIRSRVKYKSLRDAVGTEVDSMMSSSVSKNSEMSLFAAQIELALIDLLEEYFEKSEPGRSPERSHSESPRVENAL